MKSVTAPTRRLLYALTASLQGIILEAFVYPHGTCGFFFSVLVDQVHVPGSPSGKFVTSEAAVKAAKDLFTHWMMEILKRI